MEDKQKKEEIIDFVKTIIIAGSVMLFIRFFIAQPFVVKGSSMEPNFYGKDYLIVDELSYKFHKPNRGDVIVFKLKDQNINEYLIKRVIGLPGDTVVVKDGHVYVKNSDKQLILEEPYLPIDRYTKGELTETIKEDNYFVLGDNREVSLDSRYFGQISKNIITGKVLLRGFPFNKFGLIESGNPILK